jgi:hypothetical protein
MTGMKDATTSHPRTAGTDELIHALATQAGDRPIGRGPLMALPFRLTLLAGVTLAAFCALAVVVLAVGPRPDLGGILTTWTFQFKVVAMVLLAAGAGLLVRAAAIPGVVTRPVLPLLPAALFMLAGIALDGSGFPLTGARTFSIPSCMGVIVLAALPALGVLFAAMRRGIPTRPGLAGGLAGILAGSLGALAYTIACINDGATFVALWYTLAIAVVAAIGAVAGKRALAW